MARILIASLVDPATHPGGAGTYTRGLVAALQRGRSRHDVELVGPLQAPPGPWYRWRQAASLVRSSCSPYPAKALFARRQELRTNIQKALRSGRYDLLVINGGDMLWVLDELPLEMPSILVAHNLEHRLLDQQLADHRVLAPLFRRERPKQRRYELEGFSRVCGVVFVSAAEMAWSTAQVPDLRALHVPPLFVQSPAVRVRRGRDRLRLGYLADFAWWPNHRNWVWLVDEVLPHVRRPVEVHVYGRQSDRIAPRDGVVIHGVVSDLNAVWEQADFMVCPIRAGAGVSVKVAESLYNRMPVLATPQAVQGFACASGGGLAVKDGVEAWAAFLNSPDADLLATQVPSEELRGQFALDRHVDALDRFIDDVAFGCRIRSMRPPNRSAASSVNGLAGARDC